MAKTVNNQHGASLNDIYEVVTFIKDNAVARDEFNDEISGIKTEISGLKVEASGIKGEISGIKGQVASIKATMVTKDYLDEKMSDLRGDLVVTMRKEDTKLKTLVSVLKEKTVLDNDDVKRIYSMEPFAQ